MASLPLVAQHRINGYLRLCGMAVLLGGSKPSPAAARIHGMWLPANHPTSVKVCPRRSADHLGRSPDSLWSGSRSSPEATAGRLRSTSGVGWESRQFVDETADNEGSPWWRSRRRVAQVLDGTGAVMDVATIVVPVLNGGSPAILVTTGLLAFGLHSAARHVRRKR